jgi:hypothetical protein
MNREIRNASPKILHALRALDASEHTGYNALIPEGREKAAWDLLCSDPCVVQVEAIFYGELSDSAMMG